MQFLPKFTKCILANIRLRFGRLKSLDREVMTLAVAGLFLFCLYLVIKLSSWGIMEMIEETVFKGKFLDKKVLLNLLMVVISIYAYRYLKFSSNDNAKKIVAFTDKWFVSEKLLSKEAWFFLIYVFVIRKVGDYRSEFYYAALYLIFLYYANGNLLRSLWISFVSLMLLNKGIAETISYPVVYSFFPDLNISFFLPYSDLVLVAILYVIWSRKIGGEVLKNSFDTKDKMLAIMIVLGFVSAVISKTPYMYGWYTWIIFVKYILVFYVARIILFEDRNSLKPTMEVIILFCVFNSVMMVLQKQNGGPLGWGIEDKDPYFVYGRFADEIKSLYRPGGVSWNANLTGSILSMILPFTIMAAFKKTIYNPWVMRLSFVMILVGIFLTSSRFVWILSGITLFYLLKHVDTKQYLEIKNIAYNRLVKIAASILLITVLPYMFYRISTMFSDNSGFISRWNYLTMSYDLMIKNPLGVGLDSFKYEILDFDPKLYNSVPTPPHNILAEIGTGIGWVGVVAYSVFMYVLLKKCFLALKRQMNSDLIITSFSAIFIIYFLLGMVYSSLFSATITQLFWLLLGFFYVHDITKKTV